MVGNTANRTAEIKAGTFAVVNTNGNLDATLVDDTNVGVSFSKQDEGDAKNNKVDQKTNYTLTDASLDIASATSDVVIPNVPRDQVKNVVALSELSESAPNLRDTNIFSAFKWDITFTLSFPQGATKDVGLFFNASESWAHTAFVAKENDESDGNVYSDAACTSVVANETALTAGKTYYRLGPSVEYVASPLNVGSTAYGFRMAFIPKTIAGASEGYGKVWSPFRANNAGGCTYIEGATEEVTALPGSPASYTTKTVKGTGGSVTAYTELASGKGLIDPNTTNKIVPNNSAINAATALSTYENYLGFFDCPANGGNVSMTYTIVVWYEGTDISIVPEATVFEQVTTSLTFGVADLA